MQPGCTGLQPGLLAGGAHRHELGAPLRLHRPLRAIGLRRLQHHGLAELREQVLALLRHPPVVLLHVEELPLDQLSFDRVPTLGCAGRLLSGPGTGVRPERVGASCGDGAAAGSGDERWHRLLWTLQRGRHGSRRASGVARTSGCARSAASGGHTTRPWLGQWPGHGRSGRAWPCLTDGEVQGSREEGAMLGEQPGVLHGTLAQQARGRKLRWRCTRARGSGTPCP